MAMNAVLLPMAAPNLSYPTENVAEKVLRRAEIAKVSSVLCELAFVQLITAGRSQSTRPFGLGKLQSTERLAEPSIEKLRARSHGTAAKKKTIFEWRCRGIRLLID